YELLVTGSEPYLGILLEYPKSISLETQTVHLRPEASSRASKESATRGRGRAQVRIGVIGAGNYAGRVLIPALRTTKASLVVIANMGGITATHFGKRYGFQRVTTDVESVMADPEIDTVVIATQHDSHARLVVNALRAGKHTFVEKPLALSISELEEIQQVWQ